MHDLPEQVGSFEEIAIQPGIRASSRPESFPDKASLQAGCPELTPGINRNDGATKAEWKTQDDVKTSTNTESGQVSQGRGSEKHLSGSDQFVPMTELWCSEEGRLSSPSDVKLNKDQRSLQQTSSGGNNLLTAADNVEMTLLSPATQTENLTEKTPSSNEPHSASTPPSISGPLVESELPVSSESPSSEGGRDFREVTPEASSTVSTSLLSDVVAPSLEDFGPNKEQEEKTASLDASASLNYSTPNLMVSTPIPQSREVLKDCGFDSERSNVSTCETKGKIKKIETVSPKVTTFPYQEPEGDADPEMEGGTDDQSSDLKSQFNAEEFLIQSQTETPQLAIEPVNQLPLNMVTHPETERKHGIKGQRVSLYVVFAFI